MCAVNTSAPQYVQLKKDMPEVVAVNAIFTLGFIVIVSTKRRYGGFAKAVGLRAMTTPHGLGYAKIVIVVDETIDPFDLRQVMWAVSTKVNPAGDVIMLPNLCIDLLDPSAEPAGISHRMIIDATTAVWPDKRGSFGQQLPAADGRVAQEAQRDAEGAAEMNRPEESKHGLVCPRCRSVTIDVLTNSPVEGVWTIYSCKTCLYAWRSTEPEENTDPDKYPEAFRLKPEDLARFPVVPTIPPLRRS